RVRMLLGAVGAIVVVSLALLPMTGPALLRLVGVLTFGVVTLSISGWSILDSSLRLLRPAVLRIPRIGVLIGHSIAGVASSGLSFTAMSSVAAFLTLLLTVVQSTVRSIDAWVIATHSNAISVRAGAPNAGLGGEPITKEVVDIVRRTAGVDDVLEYFATTIPFEREETVLMALS